MLGTRCSPEQYEFVKNSNLPLQYDELSHILTLGESPKPSLCGKLMICAAGTADLPVAEEAKAAEFFGAQVCRQYDSCFSTGFGGKSRKIG